LPFCHGSIVAPLPPQPTRWMCRQVVPNELRTIGDHLKARRIQLHLFQMDVAKQIGVHKASVQNWERNVGTPLPSQIPAVIRFLGYVPFKHDGSLKGRLRWLRIAAGWTQEDWAKAASISAGTVGRWEDGRGINSSPIIWIAVKAFTQVFRSLGLTGLVAAELQVLQSVSQKEIANGLHRRDRKSAQR